MNHDHEEERRIDEEVMRETERLNDASRRAVAGWRFTASEHLAFRRFLTEEAFEILHRGGVVREWGSVADIAIRRVLAERAHANRPPVIRLVIPLVPMGRVF